MSYVFIDIDLSKMERQIKRFQRGPSMEDKIKLDRTLKAILERVRLKTHIDTNSLAPSGSAKSNLVGSTYRGSFAFGGPSPGPNNPVDYAIYEQRRGGAHDFMAAGGAYATDAEWIQAIKGVVDGWL